MKSNALIVRPGTQRLSCPLFGPDVAPPRPPTPPPTPPAGGAPPPAGGALRAPPAPAAAPGARSYARRPTGARRTTATTTAAIRGHDGRHVHVQFFRLDLNVRIKRRCRLLVDSTRAACNSRRSRELEWFGAQRLHLVDERVEHDVRIAIRPTHANAQGRQIDIRVEVKRHRDRARILGIATMNHVEDHRCVFRISRNGSDTILRP